MRKKKLFSIQKIMLNLFFKFLNSKMKLFLFKSKKLLEDFISEKDFLIERNRYILLSRDISKL